MMSNQGRMEKSPIRIDVTIDPVLYKEDAFCDEVITVLKEIKPAWFREQQHNLSTLKVKNFQDGLWNQLHGYYQEGKFEEDVVLMRVNGPEVYNRELETRNRKALSIAGRCPPFHATFNNGIAYGYVHGDRINQKDLTDPKIKKLIAKEMIAYHSVQPDVPETKSEFINLISDYLKQLPDRFEDSEFQARLEAKKQTVPELRKEFQELSAHLESLNSPIVFCHNDLHYLNIIYNEQDEYIRFVDHELASYNYEHYDIGYHFSFYAGIHGRDLSLYPDKAYQMDWLRYYLEQKAIHNGKAPDSVTEKDVEICYVKTNIFSLLAPFAIGMILIYQAGKLTADFDFQQFGERSLEEYFVRKKEFFTLKVPE